ncbi:MAG: phosphatidate cytidylyltransferase [Actinomycetia bacterium]|nr:phosphatidate cytidylyltransferase [Actinomycetes bacterium]
MSDDQWRRRPEDEDDFGGPLFGDEPSSGAVRRIPAPKKEPKRDLARHDTEAISFGDDTGPLQHWSEPPTGEVPSFLATTASPDANEDLDVWSSFSGNAPKWPAASPAADLGGGFADDTDDITGLHPVFEEEAVAFDDSTPVGRDVAPVRREQGRITIGTDPTDGLSTRSSSTSSPPSRRTRPESAARGPQPRGQGPRPRPSSSAGGRPGAKPAAGTAGRDMPTAIAVGLVLAAVFVGAVKFKPWAVAAIVVVVLAMAAIEYFDRVREKGYEPAYIPGIVACFTAPIAVYHYGIGSLPLVMFLALAACAVTFIGAPNIQSNPMPNMAITVLAIGWIGILGSFGAAILNFGNFGWFTADGFSSRVGTDTLCLMAIAVVANDVGALFVGSAVGKTPLREWISPNKSVEGFVGGTVMTLGAMFLVGVWGKSTSWNSTGDLLALGGVVALMAPIGDLTESMFKRNLDVKDFGTIVKGHGGVLDRFDGFLFVMPAVYYLLIHLQPWVTK